MPYKDPQKQRKAVKEASRAYRKREAAKKDVLSRKDVESVLKGHLSPAAYQILYGQKKKETKK